MSAKPEAIAFGRSPSVVFGQVSLLVGLRSAWLRLTGWMQDLLAAAQ
ncbi:hypothetical protein [Leptolyngbya sp. O-77]|nr:hypothetical protein [Leptolyngbya sp. O-77]